MRNTHVQPQFSRPYSTLVTRRTVSDCEPHVPRAVSQPDLQARAVQPAPFIPSSRTQCARPTPAQSPHLSTCAPPIATHRHPPSPYRHPRAAPWPCSRNRRPPGETSCPSRPGGAKRGCPGSLGCPGKSIRASIARTCKPQVRQVLHYSSRSYRIPVYSGKRPADFGAGLRPNESDSRESLYGSLVELAESSVMA